MTVKYEPVQLENIRDVLFLGEKMHKESAYSDMPFDMEMAAQNIFHNIIQSEYGFGLVAYKDTNPIGLLCGALATHYFGPALYAYDFAWYVTPKQRGSSTAIRMLKKFEKWAKDRGALEVHLGVTTGVSPEKTAKMFERMGYEFVGSNYTLKI